MSTNMIQLKQYLPGALLRITLYLLLLTATSWALDLGTPLPLLGAGVIIGTLIGTLLARVKLSWRNLAGFILAAIILQALAESLTYLPSKGAPYYWYNLTEHILLWLGLLLFSCLTTWGYWRSAVVIIWEIILLTSAAIATAAGHRHLHFELVRFLNDLAWQLDITDLTAIIGFGGAAGLFFTGYSYLASLLRPDPTGQSYTIKISQQERWRHWLAHIGAGILATLLCITVTALLHHLFAERTASLLNRGVGTETKAGLTPLSFETALGTSNQPSAIVRLEGDYPDNPTAPMLYFRESALSEYNGRELVLANKTYNEDVNGTAPTETYEASAGIAPEASRANIMQSVYLLANHKLAFAIDYPIEIRPLRLTNSAGTRFRSAYRVYSLAPTFSTTTIAAAEVGNPAWSPAQWEHYLTPPSDPRYQQLAQEITMGITSPIKRVKAIVDYLSRESIYTLSPGHEVSPEADPVAPFLFGDHRGYCVHFSHAMVYLFRSLGIPARIGTGYLTNLTQARDGHILLRMSDRHAWAEVYLSQLGWVVFDVQPERVETHAESPVDQALLEELMGLLANLGEELDTTEIEDDDSFQQQSQRKEIHLHLLLWIFPILALALALIKAYLLFSWWLPSKPEHCLRRLYRAARIVARDLGITRQKGETRSECRKRLRRILDCDILSMAPLLMEIVYSKDNKIDPEELQIAVNETCTAFKALPTTRKLRALLNPQATLLHLLGGTP